MRQPSLRGSSCAIALAIVVISARPTPAPEASPTASPSIKAAYEKAADELLCYCGCARLTIKDCTCGVAFELRDEFEHRLTSGATPDAIVAAYIAEHGEQSRNVPPKKGLNLLAWFGPGIAILVAAAATMIFITVWSSRGRRRAPVPASPQGDETDSLARRVEKDLKEFDV